MPLRVQQAVVGELLHGGHVDAAAEGRPRGEPRVVVEDDENVGRAFGRALQLVRRPIGLRVANVELDDTVEALGHVGSSLLSATMRDPTSQAPARRGGRGAPPSPRRAKWEAGARRCASRATTDRRVVLAAPY